MMEGCAFALSAPGLAGMVQLARHLDALKTSGIIAELERGHRSPPLFARWSAAID